MSTARESTKTSIQGVAKASKRERSFKLSLPTLVSGIDACGNPFQENTEILSISSQEATFLMNSNVTIGSKLNLSLEVPKTLILEKQLRLSLSGRVKYVKAEANSEKKQFISVELDRTFKIHALSNK
ncbi:MAG: hypothetical protein ACE5L7_00320 [Candidatus Aminicenantales bacterium]